MLALSPSTFPTFLWPLEEPNEQFYFSRNTGTTTANTTATTTPASSNLDYVSSKPEELLDLHQSTSFTAYNSGGDPNVVKKLNHNASERDRRKMMNNLYSSLRSLLPASDQMKKLSIPATVSRVLKYIPEVQKQVERLSERKEELISKIYKENQMINQHRKTTKKATDQSLVSATKLTDTEVVVQISTYTNAVQTCPLSEILCFLEEEEGLSLINSSSFQSFLGNTFYTLHLQVEGQYRLECEALSEKLVSLYEKREVLFP
ncbi:transcription factor ORG2 [Euphorbia lathyris]|uniref:transcription factor ORG2 n=1 Tax=Euphorbia lathyris TaxID=212925 RepID=UPI0033144281